MDPCPLNGAADNRSCKMTKLKQLSNKFDVLYWRENDPCTRGVQCIRNSRALFWKDLGQKQVYRALEEASQKWGMIDQEVRDFLIRQSRS